MRQFRERMKRFREEGDWSQAACSREAGLDHSEWSRIERGITTPSLPSVLRIQYALRLNSIEALFGDLPATAILSRDDPADGSGQERE